MKITIISVGKIKEDYLLKGIAEYVKRISKYAKVNEIVLPDEPIKESNESLDNEIKNIEGKRILKSIDDNSYCIALDLNGEMLSSLELADKFINICNYHSSNITFIIGGSLGLSKEVINRADYRLCFSKMTFPHKLMKLILLEQIYRAFKINNNEIYHK